MTWDLAGPSYDDDQRPPAEFIRKPGDPEESDDEAYDWMWPKTEVTEYGVSFCRKAGARPQPAHTPAAPANNPYGGDFCRKTGARPKPAPSLAAPANPYEGNFCRRTGLFPAVQQTLWADDWNVAG